MSVRLPVRKRETPQLFINGADSVIDRRSFLAFSCSTVGALRHAKLALAQVTEAFICGTPDTTPGIDDNFRMDRYSSEAGVSVGRLVAVTEEFKITPYGTVAYLRRWRGSDGLTPNTGLITLGVHFVNGSDSEKDLVRPAANAWLTGELATKLKFEFDVPQSRAQISVSFNAKKKNNSIIGRDSALYAGQTTTMNLSTGQPEVVTHEFGHALGLRHEHQNPTVAIKWKKKFVEAEMKKRYDWTPQMCEDNIFARLSKNYQCVEDSAFDKDSIMLYEIPKEWTEDGFSATANSAISKTDRKCVTGIYRA
jgi:serralysin